MSHCQLSKKAHTPQTLSLSLLPPQTLSLSLSSPHRCRESCRLLTLFPGSAKLLQELLVGVVRGGATTPIETYTAAVTTLNEFGVHTLEPVQAYQMLSNMIVQQT